MSPGATNGGAAARTCGPPAFARWHRSIPTGSGAAAPSRTPTATASCSRTARLFVRPRDDLEEVAARLLEVDPAAAEVAVDLALLPPRGVRPVVDAARAEAAEDRVELGLAHEK